MDFPCAGGAHLVRIGYVRRTGPTGQWNIRRDRKAVSEQTEWTPESVRQRYKEMAGNVSDNTPRPFLTAKGQATHKAVSMEAFLTERFVKRAKKSKVVKRDEFYQALCDLRFGYDPEKADKGHEGKGIIKVNPGSKHDHALAKKLYERFLYSVKGEDLLKRFGVDHRKCQGVKIPVDGLCLLGFIQCGKTEDTWKETLVLVDVEE